MVLSQKDHLITGLFYFLVAQVTQVSFLNPLMKNNLKIVCLVLNEIHTNTLSNKESLAAYTDVPILPFAKGSIEFFNSKIERLI